MRTKYILFLTVASCAGGVAGLSSLLPPEDTSAAAAPQVELQSSAFLRIVCSGIVEAVHGNVDVLAEINGQLSEVFVQEGDVVAEGEILAVLDSSRQAADLAVAEANVRRARAELERLEAGNGKEEIEQAFAAVRAAEAELDYATGNLERVRRALAANAVAVDQFEQKRQHVDFLRHRLTSQKKQHEALVRGPLTEEINVARANAELAEARLSRARVEYGYRMIRAPIGGTILKVYRHSGDAVSIEEFTPIVQMADAEDLRIRLEVEETNVPRLEAHLDGGFEVRGSGVMGRLRLERIVPVFGPKRLFNPDTSVRYDTRTLSLLCRVEESSVTLYIGQRVTAYFDVARPEADDAQARLAEGS